MPPTKPRKLSRTWRTNGTNGSRLKEAITSSGGSSNVGAGGECVGVTAAADAGVDIVWAVDNSGSMGDEIDKIRTNLNDSFLSIIAASNLSWNLMMVTERGNGSNGICVDSPPAGALSPQCNA